MFCSIRITSDDSACFIQYESKEKVHWQRHLFVREVGGKTDKPHIQGFVLFDKIEDKKEKNKFLNARREAIRRIFKVKGNEGLSLKEIVSDEHIENTQHYLTKDQNILSTSETSETLEKWFYQYKKKKEVREAKDKGKKEGQSYSQIMDNAFVLYLSEIQQYEHYKLDNPRVLVKDFVLSYVGKGIKQHGEIDISKWVWMLLSRHYPKLYYESMNKQLKLRLPEEFF